MSERAASEIISYVLVFSLVVSSVGIVSVGGLNSLQDTQRAEQLENAERAFDVLADNLADVYQRDAPSRATEISLGDAQLSAGNAVTIRIRLLDGSDSTWINETTRPIVYSTRNGRQILYEAGAVFRTNRDGGIRIRDPPMVVQSDSVLLPVVALNSDGIQSLGGSTVLVRTAKQNTTVVRRDTVSVDEVEITVESPRAPYWESYLDENGFNCPPPTSDTLECDPKPVDQLYVVTHNISVDIEP